ncbi:DUF6197 family protein [Couchioplanes caeruleus]|uniref:Uncharacterized protein n=2 Tax=Couchioplanes caeruleus TaxID=56438 RepID=A0A1K0FKB6_9ACTN|nr:hypothetical protein [Couchioplanes caeruleus]OJF13301.1 hypothetical protein BG844_15930 [Couchioplanes caeruleus subsp. caeruleus]ROP33504.1 hypothetical protein EDD30_6491 [Couchioplanes caeruleus]
MNPTHHQNSTPQPGHDADGPAGWLAGLLTDDNRFRAWVGSAIATAARPVTLPDNPEPDGYVVTDAGLKALADTGEAPGTAAMVLRLAALYLQRHGWIQGAYYDLSATVFTPAADMVGAIGMVCYGGPVEAPAQHFDDPGFLDFEEAVLHLDRYLLVMDGSQAYEFNDAHGRTAGQVTDVLRRAAAIPAAELIDALRIVHADDARRAQLFGGDAE